MSFGEILKAERTRQGLSRAALARKSGTTEVAVWRLEERGSVPDGDVLASLLLKLELPPGSLRRALRAVAR